MKTPSASQRRIGSPTITAAGNFGCTTPNNSAPTSPHSQSLVAPTAASISRTSPVQQQHFSHFVPTLQQHQARFPSSQLTSPSSTVFASPHGLSATNILGRPAVSLANNYASGGRTSVSALVSPRTPLSINPNLSTPHSTHVSPHSSSNLLMPVPTTSPFQVFDVSFVIEWPVILLNYFGKDWKSLRKIFLSLKVFEI